MKTSKNSQHESSDLPSGYLSLDGPRFYSLLLLGYDAVVVYYALCSPGFSKFADGLQSETALSDYLCKRKEVVFKTCADLALAGLLSREQKDAELQVIHPKDISTHDMFHQILKAIRHKGNLAANTSARKRHWKRVNATKDWHQDSELLHPSFDRLPFSQIDQVFRSFTTRETCVLLDLLIYAKGKDSFPPCFSSMALRLGMTRSTVSRIVKDFQSCGLLSLNRRIDKSFKLTFTGMLPIRVPEGKIWPKEQISAFNACVHRHNDVVLKVKRHEPVTDVTKVQLTEAQKKLVPEAASGIEFKGLAISMAVNEARKHEANALAAADDEERSRALTAGSVVLRAPMPLRSLADTRPLDLSDQQSIVDGVEFAGAYFLHLQLLAQNGGDEKLQQRVARTVQMISERAEDVQSNPPQIITIDTQGGAEATSEVPHERSQDPQTPDATQCGDPADRAGVRIDPTTGFRRL